MLKLLLLDQPRKKRRNIERKQLMNPLMTFKAIRGTLKKNLDLASFPAMRGRKRDIHPSKRLLLNLEKITLIKCRKMKCFSNLNSNLGRILMSHRLMILRTETRLRKSMKSTTTFLKLQILINPKRL